jgi:HD-GYP domain-containing protein (c-di-GMP phosphodiesterase class II)/methanogenic corrinoid protein MtbC1
VSGATQVSLRPPAKRGAAPPHPPGAGRPTNDRTTNDRQDAARTRGGELERAEKRAGVSPLGDGPPGRKPSSGGEPSSARSTMRWAPWVALGAAGLGVVVATGSVAAVIGGVVLACAATALVWSGGEYRRAALQQEIDGRSGELKRALSELEIAHAETVRRLSMAVEFRDEDTGAHIERIGRFSRLLGEQIGMDPEFCVRLSHAAPLHDVGKVAIPDAILLKPGPLTPAERAIIETHAEEGHRLVRGSSSAILDLAATIALSHQEKWDGTGYPRGLAGEAIPIEGRIVAVADVFDALTSDRPYRKAFPVEEAVRMMLDQRGRHFDPVLLDAFMEVLGRSGPDAREQTRVDPQVLVENTLGAYSTALERGDAEMAEDAIATAVEGGIPPTMLHGEVIAPALRRISRLSAAGEIDAQREQRATAITRRVLATLYRYMLDGVEPTRERVLLAGADGDGHALGLQMMHDQLAAAGYKTILDTHLSVERLRVMVESESPDLIVLGATTGVDAQALERAVDDLRASHPDIPIVLGGGAVGGGLPYERHGTRVLERIDESVEAVEEILGGTRTEPSL